MCGTCDIVKDDFIGQTFPTQKGGLLTVVGDNGLTRYKKKYKLTCSICSLDTELFPDLFESPKGHLVNGQVPCGCSKKPKWKPFQVEIIARRLCVEAGYEFLGFHDGYKNQRSKFSYNCPVHGKQTASYISFVNQGCRCPSCGIDSQKDKCRNSEAETITKELCEKEGYEFLGFPEGYKNQRSEFSYNCPVHGKQTVSYNNFVNTGTRCPSCAVSGYQPAKQGYLYTTLWAHPEQEDDYLGDSFVKIGITNFLEQRIKQQCGKTEYKPHQIIVFKFEDGCIPQELERLTKPYRQDKNDPHTPKELFGDGHTEIIGDWLDTHTCIELFIDEIKKNGYNPEIVVGKRLYNKLMNIDEQPMRKVIDNHIDSMCDKISEKFRGKQYEAYASRS